MKFSIITPMYNSFHLMENYFKNLEKQTYNNFEVIIIDDCSTDDSYEKLLSYKTNSSLNIVIIKNDKNSGPGITRNKGLQKARGRYITFIDSDDYIEKNCLQEINNTIIEKNADCIIFDYYKKNEMKHESCHSIPRVKEGIINQNTAIANASGSTWCKVYKTEIIKNNHINFPNLMRYEDMVFSKLALPYFQNIYYLKKPLYYYVVHDKSIVHNNKYVDENFAINAFKMIEIKLKHKYSNEVETIFVRELLYTTVLTLIEKKVDKQTVIDHIKYLEEKYPHWYKNENIKDFSRHQRIVLKLIQYKNIMGLSLINYVRKILKQ